MILTLYNKIMQLVYFFVCPKVNYTSVSFCSLTGIVLEAKGIKEHHWKPFIKQLFEKKVRLVFLNYC